jgi:hypothetical protein
MGIRALRLVAGYRRRGRHVRGGGRVGQPGSARQGVEAADENDGRIVDSAMTPVSSQLNFYWNAAGKVHDWRGQNLSRQADDQSAMAVNGTEHNVTIAAYDPSFSWGECISTYTQDDGSTTWHRQAYVVCPGRRQRRRGDRRAVLDLRQRRGRLLRGTGGAGSTWSDTRISGISFPMDTPAIAAN